MQAIEIVNLTKSYGKARGIIDLNLTVAEGEIFGFIGPNGAGKSTTIRTLLAFIYPNAGSAKIFGQDCFTRSEEIKREVGYLPAEVNYYDDMKVGELLYNGRMNDIIQRLAEEDVVNVLIEEPSLEEIFMHYYEK